MTTYDSATPYTASYIVLRKDGKIALVLRSNTAWMNGFYTLPSGKVEWNESYTACAIREAYEEAGVTIQPKDLACVLTAHRYAGDSDASHWVDLCFEAASWQGEAHNAEPQTHGELIWVEPKNLPENTVPATRFYIEQIEAGNTYAEYGWAPSSD